MALRDNNSLIMDVVGITDLVFNHFKDKFKYPSLSCPGLEGVEFNTLSSMESKDIEHPFSLQDIKEAIWNSTDDKIPGSDGFSMSFDKVTRYIICNDLHDCINEFFTKAHLHKALAAGVTP